MEWDTNPLLREEIQATTDLRRAPASRYQWTEGGGLAVVSWQGHTIGTVQSNGAYILKWRHVEHRGQAGSLAQAVRFMTRWLAARGSGSPLLPADKGPSTLVPLGDFLRDYADNDF